MSTEDWRVVTDPHPGFGIFEWRMRAFVLEWRGRFVDGKYTPWQPRTADNSKYGCVGYSTPEREALWLELFLHP